MTHSRGETLSNADNMRLFHVPQTDCPLHRSLSNVQHNIHKSDRQQLISDSQTIMQASTPESAAELYNNHTRLNLCEQYADWQVHTENYWNCHQLWAMT